MRPPILCVAVLLLAFSWTASGRKSGHPIRSLAEEPPLDAADTADSATPGTVPGTAIATTIAAAGSTDAPAGSRPAAAASHFWKRRKNSMNGGTGCDSGCNGGCSGGCSGGCGGGCGGCAPPSPCGGGCGGGCPPTAPPCSACGSYGSGWGMYGRKLQSFGAAAEEAAKEVAALQKRVTELEQAQHDMASVVAALQQQLGVMQERMAAQAKSA
ncbi:hypothetical protein COO60DRAFT_1504927 [Scenedesmus sp. NREL 46B-D3]|nr:hypothetical protein COO60DRAFT_1504927 [Scenedesmus sp. NREL 46B-D3]